MRWLSSVFAVLALGFYALSVLPAAAQQGIGRANQTQALISDTLSVEAYAGLLTGQSQEFVFTDHGGTISRLDWRVSAPVVGGTATFRPFDRVRLQLGGFTSVGSGTNAMDDYDWFVPGTQNFSGNPNWSEWSTHSATRLNYARMADVNLRYLVGEKPLDKGLWSFELLAGFRHMALNWSAYDGSHIYSSSGVFRGDSGTFNGIVISYAQNFYLPYIGFGTSFSRGPWQLDLEFAGTSLGFASERDYHHLRSLEFISNYTNLVYLGGKASLGYRLSDRYTLFGRLDYQHIFNGVADVRMTDNTTSANTVTYFQNGGGLNSQTMVLAFGLKGRLY